MRVGGSRMLRSSSALDLSSHDNNTDEKTMSENGVAQMLAENPEIDMWTELNVQQWLQKSGLDKIEGIEVLFSRNQINGQRLLSLTETELK